MKKEVVSNKFNNVKNKSDSKYQNNPLSHFNWFARYEHLAETTYRKQSSS